MKNMRIIKLFLFLLFLAAISVESWPQVPGGMAPRGQRPRQSGSEKKMQSKKEGVTYTVSGRLQEENSSEKMMFANVGIMRIKDSSFVRGASSDENGKFTIAAVPQGRYLLRVSSMGYQNTYLPVLVNANVDLGTIKVKKEAFMLEELVIKEKKPLYAVDGEKTLYNVTEDPSIQTGTTSDALQNAPGVEVDIEGNITLRGVSGVEIWINDKPSRLNEENLKTYIQQLPANALERIEVITNPSARYGSKTDGGIINIVTNARIKRNSFLSFGLNGSTQPNASPWLSYMWANEKWSFNVYAGGWYSKRKNESDGYSYSLNQNKDTVSYQSYQTEGINTSLFGNININATYIIDSINTLTMWMGFNGNMRKNNSYEERYRNERQQEYNYTTENESDGNSLFGNIGIAYEHKFNNEGHQIMADIGGMLSESYSQSSFVRLYEQQVFLNRDKKATNTNNTPRIDASVDYTYPYSRNGEIGLGISAEKNWDITRYSPDTLVWNTDQRNLDSLRFLDASAIGNNFEGYITVRHKFGNFTVKGGLRTEYSSYSYTIYNSPENNVEGIHYFNLRPSLHLSYRTKSMHNFSLSYSRRISNPDVSQLTTYKTYSEDSYFVGNPSLEPTYTNSFEGGWSKFFENFGSIGISAYHRNSTNQVNTIVTSIYDTEVFERYINYSYPVNLGASYNTGAELRITYRPMDFMNIRFYANIYDSYIEYIEGSEEISSHKTSYSLRVNAWAKLWNRFEVFASARYRSPTQALYSESKATYSIDCGVRADFLKRKISVHVNVRDIFNWNKTEDITNNPYYISYNSNRITNSRFISAGLTFRFGKMELENRVKTGTGDFSSGE